MGNTNASPVGGPFVDQLFVEPLPFCGAPCREWQRQGGGDWPQKFAGQRASSTAVLHAVLASPCERWIAVDARRDRCFGVPQAVARSVQMTAYSIADSTGELAELASPWRL